METSFQDTRNWIYKFSIKESDFFMNLKFFTLVSIDNRGRQVHREEIYFRESEDIIFWQEYHTRDEDPLISKEGRDFCEQSVKSFMAMKAFW
jgi:hypothetical protein